MWGWDALLCAPAVSPTAGMDLLPRVQTLGSWGVESLCNSSDSPEFSPGPGKEFAAQ